MHRIIVLILAGSLIAGTLILGGCASSSASNNSVIDPASAGAPQGEINQATHNFPAPGSEPKPAGDTKNVKYTCPMHPEIVRGAPGKCPKCDMKLVPKK